MSTPDERTAAMDALIADSADMIAPVGEVERVARIIEGALVRHGVTDFTGTLDDANAALAAMSPAGEVEQRGYDRAIAEVVAWLRGYDRDETNWPQFLARAIEAGEHKP